MTHPFLSTAATLRKIAKRTQEPDTTGSEKIRNEPKPPDHVRLADSFINVIYTLASRSSIPLNPPKQDEHDKGEDAKGR